MDMYILRFVGFFGLYEFNKTHMGAHIYCNELNRNDFNDKLNEIGLGYGISSLFDDKLNRNYIKLYVNLCYIKLCCVVLFCV